MADKLRPPVAVCTACRCTSDRANVINQPCRRNFGKGKSCKGVMGSALSNGDWEECAFCHATGYEGNSRCTHCQGDGWFYARKH